MDYVTCGFLGNRGAFRVFRPLAAAALFLAGLLLWLAANAPVSAQTYRFVSPDGDDTANDCSDMDFPCATFAHALASADPEDVIFAAEGTYTEAPITLTFDIYLVGENSDTTFVQAAADPTSAANPVFFVSPGITAVIDSFVIQHGFNSGCGGGIYNEGDLYLQNVTLGPNRASTGGGVCTVGGFLGVVDSILFSNTAFLDGGGLSIDAGEVYMAGTSITGNVASLAGGGMAVHSSTVTMDGDEITANSAITGAGLYMAGAGCAIEANGVGISGNQATGDGGGAYQGDGWLSIQDSEVKDNRAGRGGAVFVWQGELHVSDSDAEGNEATGNGGTLFVGGSPDVASSARLTRTWVFSSSSAAGALYVHNPPGRLYVSRGQIRGNVATLRGGAVDTFLGTAVISGVEVVANQAGAGGALYQEAGSTIDIQRSCIQGNSHTGVVAVSPVMTATGNWWNAGDGPSGAGPGGWDSISADVFYTPFLTAPLPFCETVPSWVVPVFLPVTIKD